MLGIQSVRAFFKKLGRLSNWQFEKIISTEKYSTTDGLMPKLYTTFILLAWCYFLLSFL